MLGQARSDPLVPHPPVADYTSSCTDPRADPNPAILPRDVRALRVLSAVLVLPLLVGGCYLGYPDYDQRDGSGIASNINGAKSPIIDDVWYHPGNYTDPATVNIQLRAGATPDEARAFICEVAMPIVRSGNPPDDLSVVAWDTQTRVVASDSDPCPTPP